MAKPKTRAGTGKKAVSISKGGVQPKKKVGRPPAKHSSPDYVQMSLYVHKDVRNKVKVRLFEQGAEFSALVESTIISLRYADTPTYCSFRPTPSSAGISATHWRLPDYATRHAARVANTSLSVRSGFILNSRADTSSRLTS